MAAAGGAIRRDRPAPGVLRLELQAPVMDPAVHGELARIWPELDADPETRAVIITGGEDFSAPGDPSQLAGDLVAASEEARAIVLGMLDCATPIVSAARGWAVGAGLAVLVLADVSIAAEDARLADGHLRIGVVPGDHAALLWPLLCGLAKAKYYLLTGRPMSGAEAERINLISLTVPDAELDATALRTAERLAAAPPDTVRWTKRVLNHWVRQATPTFDASLAYEMLSVQLPRNRADDPASS